MNGGVWKTTDYGRTWKPIFDDQPTGSIGAIAVAPSDPEHHLRRQRRGPAAARSLDRRRHLQVRPTPARPGRISACATASRFRRSSSTRANPDRLFVAVLGHPYGPNEERGIFRSTDGGERFEKVLYKDENTGGIDLAFDPVERESRLRRAVGGAAGAVGERRVSRARQRPVQVDRRRHHLAAADARACRRSTRGSAASASRSRRAIRSACTRPSTPARPAASTARTTRARAGSQITDDPRVVDARRRFRRGQGRSRRIPTSSTPRAS